MKHVATIGILGFTLIAADTLDTNDGAVPLPLIGEDLIGPHVHIDAVLKEYFLPSNACKVENAADPIDVIITSCKKQRKCWLKI